MERPFKLLSNKCFIISDYVEDMKKIIPDGIVYAKTPSEFIEKIFYYMEKPVARADIARKGYNCVMNNHTYFHRVSHMFNKLGRPDLGQKALDTLQEFKEKIGL